MPERPPYITAIPPDADTRTVERYGKTKPKRLDYYVGGELIGRRWFAKDGSLEGEETFRNGRLHGMQYRRDGDALLSVEPFEDGVPHGTAYQFGRSGKVIGTYTLEHGTGIDLWRQEWSDGSVTLSEVHYLRDGKQHGYEWWVDANQAAVHHERHWHAGEIHGIEREWNHRGRLRRGYPQYWVKNTRVDKRTYLRRAAKDGSLPPFRPEDDDPHRTFPPEVAAALGEPYCG